MNEDNWIDRGARLLIATIIGILLLWTMGFFSSCTRTVYVPQTSIQRDSIFQFLKADTMYIEKWHTKYVERLSTDTLYVDRSDTLRIPYPVEKPLTFSQKAWMKIGKVSAGFAFTTLIALFIYFYVRRDR